MLCVSDVLLIVAVSMHASAVCVDGGIYAGGLSFLQVTETGHFIRHQRLQGEWLHDDLTEHLCAPVDPGRNGEL